MHGTRTGAFTKPAGLRHNCRRSARTCFCPAGLAAEGPRRQRAARRRPHRHRCRLRSARQRRARPHGGDSHVLVIPSPSPAARSRRSDAAGDSPMATLHRPARQSANEGAVKVAAPRSLDLRAVRGHGRLPRRLPVLPRDREPPIMLPSPLRPLCSAAMKRAWRSSARIAPTSRAGVRANQEPGRVRYRRGRAPLTPQTARKNSHQGSACLARVSQHPPPGVP